MTHKTCTKCQQLLPLEAFGKNVRRKDGLSLYCRPCKAALRALWAAANPEKERANKARYIAKHKDREKARAAAWRAANADAHRARSAAWRAANPERSSALKAAWAATNPERVKTIQAEYAARATDGFVTRALTRKERRLTPDQIPQALIELKRAQLKLLRLIKEKTK